MVNEISCKISSRRCKIFYFIAGFDRNTGFESQLVKGKSIGTKLFKKKLARDCGKPDDFVRCCIAKEWKIAVS